MLLSTLIIPCLALTLIISITSSANEVQVNIDGTSTSATLPEAVVVVDDLTASDLNEDLTASDLNEDDWDHGEDLGFTQDYDVDHTHEIQAKLQEARSYLETQIYPKHAVLRDKCRNKHESCTFWAVMGECDKNAAYMNEICAPVCLACESMLMELRCPVDPDAVDVWQPGDLNRMFERIVTHPDFAKYEPRVLSRPSLLPGETANEESSSATAASYQVGPWLITLDKFMSPEEADQLIELSKEEGYERSYRVGGLQWDGTSVTYFDDSRTSSSVYCQTVCFSNATTRAVMQRMEQVTGIPERNYQHLQFIRYETGQLFTVHHDYIPHQRHRQQGVRIFTVFFYFSDVEEGGGTNFPLLNLTIMPKKGRVVIWPLVRDEDPHSSDERMDHQGLPVVRGIKYGMF